MKRYLLSLAILVVGLFWVGVGAPVWGGESPLAPPQPKPEAPDLSDAMLSPYDAERDAGVMKILNQNKAVASMLAGRELGRDYWIRMSYVYEDASADNSGPYPIDMVDIYFDPPVSYAGEVPDPQNPGKTKDWTFTDVQLVTARTDLEKGVVTEVFYVGPPGDWGLGEIKGRYAELFPNGVPVHKESELIDGLTGQFRNPWWP